MVRTPPPGTTRTVKQIVSDWLGSRVRAGKISRNTIAVGMVVLDKVKQGCPLEPADLFSGGGELKGSRSGLSAVLQRYGLPVRFLKEATTRQARQDARALVESLDYGKPLMHLDVTSRNRQLDEGLALLTALARKWLSKQPIKVACDRNQSPALWIRLILEKAQGRSGGVVEQHLVGAKLQRRHPEITVPNHPGHAADAQTGRSGDFPLHALSYHVTATDGKGTIERCQENVQSGVHPVLLLPKRFVEKALVYAEVAGIQERISVLSIEDFITQNIIEMSTQGNQDFFATLKEIIEEYNRRLEQVETDMSLKIEVC